MRYRIPEEVPRGRATYLAVRASTPYWAMIVGGFLPALLWSIANAWFLGCRDARWQTAFGVIGYIVVAGIGAARMSLWRSGMLYAWFETNGRLVHALMGTLYIIGAMVVVRLLVGRQVDLAAYRSTLGQPLSWGIVMIGALFLADRFGIRPLVYPVLNEIIWIWGPSPL